MQNPTDIWREMRPPLRAYIARRIPNRSDVDDVVQDVFLKAAEKIETVQSQESMRGWLYRIAANTIVDRYRGRRNFEEIPEQLAAPEAVRNHVVELARCISPFIASLPETYRDALVLSEIEGLPQREVADRLGISLSGAKSRVQRGREKLRQKVLECCDVEMGRGGLLGYEPRTTSSVCK